MPNEDPHPESKPTRKHRLVVIPILAAFFILDVLGLLIFDSVSAPPEAEFHGITISEWLKNYHQLKQRNWRETDSAMRSFGTNNIEFILDAFTENESLWRRIRSQILQSGPGWMARFVGRNPSRRLDTQPNKWPPLGAWRISASCRRARFRKCIGACPTRRPTVSRGPPSTIPSRKLNRLPGVTGIERRTILRHPLATGLEFWTFAAKTRYCSHERDYPRRAN